MQRQLLECLTAPDGTSRLSPVAVEKEAAGGEILAGVVEAEGGQRFAIRQGILDLLGAQAGALSLAQRSNRWEPVAR